MLRSSFNPKGLKSHRASGGVESAVIGASFDGPRVD